MRIGLITLLSFLLPCSFFVDAQEQTAVNSAIMLSYSTANECKLISETVCSTNNHLGYAYLEIGNTPFSEDASKWFYSQLFWEQKFWSLPLFIHAEMRTFLTDGYYDFQYYAGAAYTFYFPHGYLALEPLYRYNITDGHGAQFSVVGGWDWKHFNLAHFTDIYTGHCMNGKVVIYNELRFFYKINHIVEVGAIGIASYTPPRQWNSYSAALALKVNI